MTERFGPLIKGSESLETASPEECKFHAHLIFFYGASPAYDYPICLHPKVCRSSSADKSYYRTEQIGCNPDNCLFIQKIEKGLFSELTFEVLAQEEIVQLPEVSGFHLAHEPHWYIPPSDFAEKSVWGLFTNEEATKIEKLSERIKGSGFGRVSGLAELGIIIRKHAERKKEDQK